MWLMTTFGFFSVVQKAGTEGLTIRARVGADLDRLRDRYLPGLTATQSTPRSDYAYRAKTTHAELAAAMAKIVADVTYDNFKSEVEAVQGYARESVYAEVWSVLHGGLPPLDRGDRFVATREPAAPGDAGPGARGARRRRPRAAP